MPISPTVFEREAQRRLIDAYDLAIALGLRGRQSVWDRVRAGTLPQPVIRTATGALWDRDVLDLPTDRKA